MRRGVFMSYRKLMTRIIVSVCMLLGLSVTLPAQLTEGTIAVTVKDSSGAAVPSATVTTQRSWAPAAKSRRSPTTSATPAFRT